MDRILSVIWQQLLMYGVGILLIWLAVKKEYEPALLLPTGLGAILANLPLTGVINQTLLGVGEVNGIIEWLFDVGIGAPEALPILLFIRIGAMIDSEPLPSQPVMFLFDTAAQFGIFFTVYAATLIGFDLTDTVSIGIVGAVDRPTSTLVSQILHSKYVRIIMVVAYSYMAPVSIMQPFVIRLVTIKKERQVSMECKPGNVSKSMRIAFPVVMAMIMGTMAPMSVALVDFLMFGNLPGECGALEDLSDIVQHTLVNLITLLLGIAISFSVGADVFVEMGILMIMVTGLLAFVFDTIGGVLLAKLLNLFLKVKMDPVIGTAGVSVLPTSAGVVQKMTQKEKSGNIVLIHAVGTNVSGQIASVVAGGLIISLVSGFLQKI